MSDRALYPHEEVASFLAHVCNKVGTGGMGGITTAIVFAHGADGHPAALLTYPLQPIDQTIAELEAALEWLRGPAGARLRMKVGATQAIEQIKAAAAFMEQQDQRKQS